MSTPQDRYPIAITFDAESHREFNAALKAADDTIVRMSADLDRLQRELTGSEKSTQTATGALRKARTVADELGLSIEKLNRKADLADAKRSSEAYLGAVRRTSVAVDALKTAEKEAGRVISQSAQRWDKLTRSIERQTSANDRASTSTRGLSVGMALTANAALELAQKGIQAVRVVFDIARAGDQAARVLKAFRGDIVSLRDAGVGLVTDTDLQRFDILRRELNVTRETYEGVVTFVADKASRGLAESGQLLEQTLRGEVEGLIAVGERIDVTAERFNGLSEAQKKAAIIAEIGAKGMKLNRDAIAGQATELQRADVQMQNFESDLQVMVGELLVSSGALDGMKTALAAVGEFLSDNRTTIESLATSGLKLFQASLSIVLPVLDGASVLLEGLAVGLELVADGVDAVSGLLGFLYSPVDDLIGLFGSASDETGSWETGLRALGLAAEFAGQKLAEELGEEVPVALSEMDQTLAQIQDSWERIGSDWELVGADIVGNLGGFDEATLKVARAQRETGEEIEATTEALGGLIAKFDEFKAQDNAARFDLKPAIRKAKGELILLQDRMVKLAAAERGIILSTETDDDDDDPPPRRRRKRDTSNELESAVKRFVNRDVAGGVDDFIEAANDLQAELGADGLRLVVEILNDTMLDLERTTGELLPEAFEVLGETLEEGGIQMMIDGAAELAIGLDEVSRAAIDLQETASPAVARFMRTVSASLGELGRELPETIELIRAVSSTGEGLEKGVGSSVAAVAAVAQAGAAAYAASAAVEALIGVPLELGRAAGAYPDPVGMATHFWGAAQYGIAASLAGLHSGGGGGGGGAGATGAGAAVGPSSTSSPRLPSADELDLDVERTLIVAVDVDGRSLGTEAMRGASSAARRYRSSGARLDFDVVRQRRSSRARV